MEPNTEPTNSPEQDDPGYPPQHVNDPRAGDPGADLESTTATATPGQRRVAYWHTAVLVFILLALSFGNTKSSRAVQTAHAGHTQLRIYISTIAYEWLLAGYVWWGVRRSGGTLRQLIGGRWDDLGDFLLDIALAGGVWFAAMMSIAVAAVAMGMGHGGGLEETRRQIGFLAPDSISEILGWIALSATAGFCEELIFRGYLQNQFTHLLRSRWLALPAASILFGLGHGYEGAQRMVLIALLGFAFGLISIARKSLRPAMIAHTLQDTISGLLLRALR